MTSPLNIIIYQPAASEDGEEPLDNAVYLEDAGPVLSLFSKEISGKYLEPVPLDEAPPVLASMFRIFPFSSGREVFLPRTLNVLPTYEGNWRIARLYAAIQAAQWEYGTFDRPDPGQVKSLLGRTWSKSENDPMTWIRFFVKQFPIPGLACDILTALETTRITANVTRNYRGLKEELSWFLPQIALMSVQPDEPSGVLWDAVMELLDLPSNIMLDEFLVSIIEMAGPCTEPDTSFQDILHITASIYPVLEPMLIGNCDPDDSMYRTRSRGDDDLDSARPRRARDFFLSNLEAGSGRRDDKLAESMKQLNFRELKLDENADSDKSNVVPGKIESRDARYDPDLDNRKPVRMRGQHVEDEDLIGRPILYPEWDYLGNGYRRNWVTVYTMSRLPGKKGAPGNPLDGWEEVVKEVSKQFRMLRHEEFAWRKRLKDGQEIDLDQVIRNRVDRRSGGSPSEKIYMEKRISGREVSALLLLDMSASTSYEIEEGKHKGDTVLQILLSGSAIMGKALEQLGDRYSVYGFSGFGREKVEFLEIKHFDKPLDNRTLESMGTIQPQRSTRMGAAVRHAYHILAAEPTSLKLLIILSDGFPQDIDYGENRFDREYGLRDTAKALLEAETHGILPFCISVDTAHDYMRSITPPRNYMVVKSIQDLPSGLPRIYMLLRSR
ncbi:MAG: hypothetical protein JXA49_04655 [Actinobacteria bacterium]|nr:hypothetical protein [Actinomycetota bacterium]